MGGKISKNSFPQSGSSATLSWRIVDGFFWGKERRVGWKRHGFILGSNAHQLFTVPAEDYKYVAWSDVAGGRSRGSLHDGSVDDRLDVVLSVPRVDHTLPFGVLLDVALGKQLEAHVRGHRLRTEQHKKGWGAAFLQWRWNLKLLKSFTTKPLKAELER